MYHTRDTFKISAKQLEDLEQIPIKFNGMLEKYVAVNKNMAQQISKKIKNESSNRSFGLWDWLKRFAYNTVYGKQNPQNPYYWTHRYGALGKHENVSFEGLSLKEYRELYKIATMIITEENKSAVQQKTLMEKTLEHWIKELQMQPYNDLLEETEKIEGTINGSLVIKAKSQFAILDSGHKEDISGNDYDVTDDLRDRESRSDDEQPNEPSSETEFVHEEQPEEPQEEEGDDNDRRQKFLNFLPIINDALDTVDDSNKQDAQDYLVNWVGERLDNFETFQNTMNVIQNVLNTASAKGYEKYNFDIMKNCLPITNRALLQTKARAFNVVLNGDDPELIDDEIAEIQNTDDIKYLNSVIKSVSGSGEKLGADVEPHIPQNVPQPQQQQPQPQQPTDDENDLSDQDLADLRDMFKDLGEPQPTKPQPKNSQSSKPSAPFSADPF